MIGSLGMTSQRQILIEPCPSPTLLLEGLSKPSSYPDMESDYNGSKQLFKDQMMMLLDHFILVSRNLSFINDQTANRPTL